MIGRRKYPDRLPYWRWVTKQGWLWIHLALILAIFFALLYEISGGCPGRTHREPQGFGQRWAPPGAVSSNATPLTGRHFPQFQQTRIPGR
jgi:hypothetical protein